MTQMDVKETAAYTGLSLRTVYNLVSTGKIPFQRLSPKKVVFIKEDIDDWLVNREDGRKTRKIGPPSVPQNPFPVPPYAPERAATDPFLGAAVPAGAKQSRLSPLSIFIFVFVLLSLGWAGGYVFFKVRVRPESVPTASPAPTGVDLLSLQTRARIDGLDFGQASDGLDQIQVKLDYLSQIVDLKGDISSPQIKPLLVNTLKSEEDNYAIKSKTVDVFKAHLLDPEIKSALIYALTHDQNALIRMKAMTVLSNIASSEDVASALVDRLKNDENTGIRFRALELIEGSMGRGILTVLKTLKGRDRNPIISNRIEAIFKKHQDAPPQKQKA